MSAFPVLVRVAINTIDHADGIYPLLRMAPRFAGLREPWRRSHLFCSPSHKLSSHDLLGPDPFSNFNEHCSFLLTDLLSPKSSGCLLAAWVGHRKCNFKQVGVLFANELKIKHLLARKLILASRKHMRLWVRDLNFETAWQLGFMLFVDRFFTLWAWLFEKKRFFRPELRCPKAPKQEHDFQNTSDRSSAPGERFLNLKNVNRAVRRS